MKADQSIMPKLMAYEVYEFGNYSTLLHFLTFSQVRFASAEHIEETMLYSYHIIYSLLIYR